MRSAHLRSVFFWCIGHLRESILADPEHGFEDFESCLDYGIAFGFFAGDPRLDLGCLPVYRAFATGDLAEQALSGIIRYKNHELCLGASLHGTSSH